MTDEEIDKDWIEAKNFVSLGKQREAILLYRRLAAYKVFGSHVAAASLLEELGQAGWKEDAYSLLREGVRTSDEEALLMIGRLALHKCDEFSAISYVRANRILCAVARHATSNTTRHIAAYLLGMNEVKNEGMKDLVTAKQCFRVAAENGSIPALYWLARVNAMQRNRFQTLLVGMRWAVLSSLADYRPSMRTRLMIK
jgi:hypothetical protein